MTYKELYDEANKRLDKGEITLGEWENMIDPPNEEIPQNQWILVDERLPEYGEGVLTYHDDDECRINTIIDDEDAEWLWDGVIAWMPLPEPYKILPSKKKAE